MDYTKLSSIYYNFPRQYYENNKDYGLKKVNDIIDFENKIFKNENEIQLYPQFVIEVEDNECYNIYKKIKYPNHPIKEKHYNKGGFILESYEFNKKELIENLEINNIKFDNTGFRYNYEDGNLFKYQYRVNCNLVIVPRKQLKYWGTKEKMKYKDLNNRPMYVVTYEDLSKMNVPLEYDYLNYFEEFDENQNIDNIFHIYWKKIFYIDYNQNTILKKNTMFKLKSSVLWYIINENYFDYNILHTSIDCTIDNEHYNKPEYIQYFLNNNVYKVNDVTLEKKYELCIHKLELSELERKIYDLNVELKEHKYNLLDFLNGDTVLLKHSDCDTIENTISKIIKKNISFVKKKNVRIDTYEELIHKCENEQNILAEHNLDNELQFVGNKINYYLNEVNILKNDINLLEKHNEFVKKFNKVKQCPICLSDVNKEYVLLNCGHSLCVDCALMCKKNNNITKCPNCRFVSGNFNYVVDKKYELDENHKFSKYDIIKKTIENRISKDENILIISSYKDVLKNLENDFKKNCNYVHCKYKKNRNIFLCLYEKLPHYYKVDEDNIKEVIVVNPSISANYNREVLFKLNRNIKINYYFYKNTIEENIMKY